MKTVGLIIGHIGKPGSIDLGAGNDLDQDGLIEAFEREALMVGRYVIAAAEQLIDSGIHAIVLAHGSYEDRIRWASVAGADLVVSCHLNAGNGDYGSVYWDKRSQTGARWAETIRSLSATRLLEVGSFRSFACFDDRSVSGSKAWLYRAYGCINACFDLRPVGLVYEPCFIDRYEHRSLLTHDGLDRIGRTLADGIKECLK